MTNEPRNLALDRLTEETAEAIIFTVSAATGDPNSAIVRLLQGYLTEVREQEYSDALHDQDLGERNRQN